MRKLALSLAAFTGLTLLAGGLSACGSDEKTVVVTPPAGSTTVVTPSGAARVCPAGQTVC